VGRHSRAFHRLALGLFDDGHQIFFRDDCFSLTGGSIFFAFVYFFEKAILFFLSFGSI
jgi:hypothetical protein